MKAVGCNSTKAAALFAEAERPRHAVRAAACGDCPSPGVCSLNKCWR